MIGMNDDTRFLTENRHGQLRAEAETRRLTDADPQSATDFRGLGGALHRLGNHLFGRRIDGTDRAEVAVVADTRPAPMVLAAERTKSAGKTSVADGCSGSHVHGQVAA